MDFKKRDELLLRISRLGKSGAVPVSNDPKALRQSLDELQRRTGELQGVVSELIAEMFRGPTFGENAAIFVVDDRSSSPTFNVLDATKSAAEGLGSVANLCVFRHGLGFVFDRWVIINQFLNAPASSPPARMGGLELYSVDDNRTVFRLDTDATSQDAVMTVALWPSKVVPTAGISARATGASRGANGYIRATSLQ